MKQPIRIIRYCAVQEPDDSWSVVEVETGMAFRVQGTPMVLLPQDFAIALAELLNSLDDPSDITIH